MVARKEEEGKKRRDQAGSLCFSEEGPRRGTMKVTHPAERKTFSSEQLRKVPTPDEFTSSSLERLDRGLGVW